MQLQYCKKRRTEVVVIDNSRIMIKSPINNQYTLTGVGSVDILQSLRVNPESYFVAGIKQLRLVHHKSYKPTGVQFISFSSFYACRIMNCSHCD